MSFSVALQTYRGPLDLLLYLVRKHEIEVVDLPIAAITRQYLEYLDVLAELDVNAVGDFLEMASTLTEIKSRMVLPRSADEAELYEDPREELVQQLLEYKKFRDAASILDEQSRHWQQRFGRVANDIPPRRVDLSDQPIHEIELWDLVSAFGRVMRDSQSSQPSNIVYDDTPIQSYMHRIHDKLHASGRVAFSEMFERGMHKSAMIGVFLAILELVRHHSVRTEQQGIGEIWVLPGERFGAAAEFDHVDEYENEPAAKPAGNQ